MNTIFFKKLTASPYLKQLIFFFCGLVCFELQQVRTQRKIPVELHIFSTYTPDFVDKVREDSVQGNVILPGWPDYQKLKYSRRWSTCGMLSSEETGRIRTVSELFLPSTLSDMEIKALNESIIA